MTKFKGCTKQEKPLKEKENEDPERLKESKGISWS